MQRGLNLKSHQARPVWREQATMVLTVILGQLILTLFVASPPTAHAAVTADPDAGPRTTALLNYIRSLPAKSTNKVLSGQFAGYPNVNYINNNSFDMRLMQEVYDATGKWPAIIGTDYTGRTAANESDCRRIYYGHNQALINYYRSGGIVTLTAHYYRPDNQGGSQCGLRSSGYDLNRILPGGADRTKWLAMLDQTATGLAQLRDAGVPVIWRPLHERDGGPFWWEYDSDSVFKQVWIDMFNYFTSTKGLHNLLWAYTGGQSSYPGSAYVDIVGDDIYNDTAAEGSLTTTNYNWMTGTGQPFAYTEFGPTSSSGFDFRILINKIRSSYPKTSYFLVWCDNYRLGNPGHNYQRELMNDSWVLDRSEVSYSPR